MGKIETSKGSLQSAAKENTSLMEQITQMGYSQLAFDQALNARIANVTVNDEEPMKEIKDVEKERMKELLTLQAKEIATLQAEIGLFRKKGGHIYRRSLPTVSRRSRLPGRVRGVCASGNPRVFFCRQRPSGVAWVA